MRLEIHNLASYDPLTEVLSVDIRYQNGSSKQLAPS